MFIDVPEERLRAWNILCLKNRCCAYHIDQPDFLIKSLLTHEEGMTLIQRYLDSSKYIEFKILNYMYLYFMV